MEKTVKKTQFKGVFMLFLTAFIWGTSFVAQSVGMEDLDAFTFNGIRTLMGAGILIPFILVRDWLSGRKIDDQQLEQRKTTTKMSIRYGMRLGLVLFFASNFQQFAFYYSTSGKIAFVTSFYMFFVPVLGLFLRKKIPLLTWICVFFGIVGLYFLCIDPSNLGAINRGDILCFICSIFYAVHILFVESFADKVDGIKVSCVQFIVSGLISCLMMFIFEAPQMAAITSALPSLLYSGVMSCGIAYTFQIVGQKYAEATIASLIMCMESVFGVLAGAIILHEVLSGREIVGCVIMFVAIIISQLTDKISEKLKKA